MKKIYEIVELYYHLVALKEEVLKECINKTQWAHLEDKDLDSGPVMVYRQILNGWINRESFYPCHLILGDYLRIIISQTKY